MKKLIPPVALAALVVLPASPAQALDDETIHLEELATVHVAEEETTFLILPDGREFALPPPGFEVAAEALTTEGSPEVLPVLIVTDEDGAAAIRIGDEAVGSEAGLERLAEIESLLEEEERSLQVPHGASGIAPLASPIKCSSWDSVLLGHDWASRNVEWQYNPANQKGTDAAATLQRAANRWKGTLSDGCGFTASSKLRTSYAGTTTRAPLNNSSGGCGAWSAALNTKGWGSLPTDTLANACTYTVGAYPYRSDHKYNTRYAWNTGSSTSCSGSKYDLQGVATHEFGHTYGLGHSSQSNNQVMKPSANACESAMRTLGRGDIRGMSYLYG
ncbi:matrixin family metalloprotease [Leucobacter triazinivorans]|uniref:Matrixin family metalloprotease n=1 Tax=Leucobacter triazinivorans TaxID=1784719 RepID=A0A4P6KH04_9MICO|nr:matrixin family metalloprotease [Leucobacter triazinivorans]QBE49716.1 matrixin family metalloprotease [Leucobacter triazinivorans]